MMDLDSLTAKHPFFSSASEVETICRSFFKKYNLNYFQFIKIYKDGSFTLLCNHLKWQSFATIYLKKNNLPLVYSCLKTEVLDPNNYFFLWDHNLPDWLVSLGRQHSNIHNGICFVERHEDCYYLIAFAAPASNVGAVDFYLNHVGLLKNFIEYFRKEKSQLIQEVEKQKIALAPHQQDANKDKLLVTASNADRISVYFKGTTSYVTRQEYRCLTKLASGKTAKQIAQDLGVSPRTIETYFQRIKLRTDATSRLELISLVTK